MSHDGANVIAVDRHSGARRWITQVESNPAAMITGSPVVVNDVAYIGVSSNEETLAVATGYACCTFRGSVVALDANTGRILWKTYMAPDNHGMTGGYSGNAVWQPPAIDLARGSLYIGTGNNYEVPDSVKSCIAQNTPANQPTCFAADDYYDSAMALDLATGRVKWSRRLQGVDVWTVACIRNPNPVSCPIPSSPDFDLGGSGPNLVGGIVGFGQKSGMYWALRPEDGTIVWSSMVGPGGTLGGIEWGTATDGQRIYVAITNSTKKPYPLINGQTVTSGAWSALDVSSGKILWQTADPDGALDMGSVSVANGVVYAPSFSGKMLALNSATGAVLWSFQSGGSVLDGPSIVNGMVFWGSGYRKTTGGIGNNKVFAFSMNNGDGNGNGDSRSGQH
jgi:polyvinyl alcohol dehydrogenase (cytochrome)